MRKIYIGDDTEHVDSEEVVLTSAPQDYEGLVKRVRLMDIYADVEPYGRKAKVKVLENAGTSMMMAGGGDDMFWLNKHSEDVKRVGSMTVYYFSFGG